jgi:prepilin-type N-terminal cleavage/methylation domain-containing protein
MQLSGCSRGFTIVEMAVVILVISLLLGSILVPLGSQMKQRNRAETQRSLEEVRQGLIGYAMINGRLPRPSDTATGGTERAACATEAQCTGFVPWATLGIAPTDSWGKVLRYSVHSSFAGGASGTVLITTATFATAGRTVKTRNAGGGEVIVATNLPAVLLSHGERNLGTTVNGTALPDSPDTNTDEDVNASAGSDTFFWRPPADRAGAPGGEFDDQVVWITPSQLFNQLVAAGRLP